MFNSYARLREFAYRLRNNERGVVSFEYVIVAVLIVTAVGAAFGPGGATVSNMLGDGFAAIQTAFTAAIAAP